MKVANLIRTYFPKYTRGTLVATDGYGNILFQCVTLELPWLDNQPQISCIPEGQYQVRTRRTDKFGLHYHVQDVQGREWILFHPGNYISQLRGCILPGFHFADLNQDGIPDITDSRAALNSMLANLGPSFELNIFTAPVAGGQLTEVVIEGH